MWVRIPGELLRGVNNTSHPLSRCAIAFFIACKHTCEIEIFCEAEDGSERNL